MEIKGQIRIHRLSEKDTLKLNLWLGMRHCQYDMDAVTCDMADSLDEPDNSLFGEYGTNGEFLIPSIKWHLKLFEAGLDYEDSDEMRRFQLWLEHAMSLIPANGRAYSTPCGPQLYYDFKAVSPAGDAYSYLVWNGKEKVFFHKETFEYLHTAILARLNSGLICGKMARLDYGDVETVTVDGGIVKVERKKQQDIRKDADYVEYVSNCDPPTRPYVVYFRQDAVRDQKIFTGTAEEFKDPAVFFKEPNWKNANYPLYLGIVHSYDAFTARRDMAKKLGVDEDMVVAKEVC